MRRPAFGPFSARSTVRFTARPPRIRRRSAATRWRMEGGTSHDDAFRRRSEGSAAVAAVGCLWWLPFDQVDRTILTRSDPGGARPPEMLRPVLRAHRCLRRAGDNRGAGGGGDRRSDSRRLGGDRLSGDRRPRPAFPADARRAAHALPAPALVTTRSAAAAAVPVFAVASTERTTPLLDGRLVPLAASLVGFESIVPAALGDPSADADAPVRRRAEGQPRVPLTVPSRGASKSGLRQSPMAASGSRG